MFATSANDKLYLYSIALLFITALGIFLFFDLLAAFSAYHQFTILYTLFWLLVGIFLLRGNPKRYQISILALFLSCILTIYLIDWDSRKPFLKDFNKIEVGLTAAQTDEIMRDYVKYVSPNSTFGENGQLREGKVSYRHTTAGWGDSDIGLVVIEDGQVVQVRFYPD